MIKNITFDNERLKLSMVDGTEYIIEGEELRVLKRLLLPDEPNRMCGGNWKPNVDGARKEVSNQGTGRAILPAE